jgi:hypothetical protein
MDPQGQIFDMNGQFIGTANTNELEELQEDSSTADIQNPNTSSNNLHKSQKLSQGHIHQCFSRKNQL